ncbi:MAG: RHS repeat-associated core domain-containing protein, partial [Pseudobutyrivibrio sp.]|nr:RHS repeat-associated core domain-containing protein [Pseudobutyrivibrio sp.]
LERTVNGETESFIYDNNVISMSKSGRNYYYLQDELGSPMYMTGTDGVAVSSYAFDDFGRNIDPKTGKQRKHDYTTNGNIIQPFAFTGYQEDEVSGLKFAQARFYDASAGRFQSEDNVKGFIDNPFTLNHYGYCWGNPVGLVDNDGKLPSWGDIKQGANDLWDSACDGATKFVNDPVGTTKQFVSDHKEILVASAATVAAVGITVATCGTGAGVAAGILIAGTGGAFAYDAHKKGENVEKAFARGAMDTSVIITSAAVNPIGTVYGIGSQLAVDFLRDDISSPEAYAAAAVGGAVGDSVPLVGGLAGGVAGSLTNDLLSSGFAGKEITKTGMINNARSSALLGLVFDGFSFSMDHLSMGNVKMLIESKTNPLWFLKEYDQRTVSNYIDDWGRALFGINKGESFLLDLLNTYVDDEGCSVN